MYKVLLVEDEENAMHLLESKVLEIGADLSIVGKLPSISAAREFIEKNSLDILFLDINLRDGSGFELLENLSEVDFEIIFTTAYSQYAIEAFSVNAVDYLLKPISTERLREAVFRAIDRLKSKSDDALKNLTALMNGRANPRKLALKERGKILFVKPDEVIFIKANGAYSDIVTKSNKYLNSNNLGYFEKILNDEMFFRAHRSYLINLDQITEYYTNDHMVKMSDDTDIPIAPGALKDFLVKLSLL